MPPTDDVIEIETDAAPSTSTKSGIQILTAPDLQLDWDSSDESVICEAITTQPTSFPRANLNNAAIDLTGTDDETAYANNTSRNRYRYSIYNSNSRNTPTNHNQNVSTTLNCRSSFATCDCLEGDR